MISKITLSHTKGSYRLALSAIDFHLVAVSCFISDTSESYPFRTVLDDFETNPSIA